MLERAGCSDRNVESCSAHLVTFLDSMAIMIDENFEVFKFQKAKPIISLWCDLSEIFLKVIQYYKLTKIRHPIWQG